MTFKHKDEIIRLRSEGMTYNQISTTLGCSKGTIAWHLSDGVKLNYTTRRRKYRDNITKMIREHKEGIGCIDCGEKYPYFMLDLDHVTGSKSFNISQFRNHTIDPELIKAEIDKCEVVCANCHRMRTHQRSLK